MAKPSLILSLSLCLLFLLVHGSLARQQREQFGECQLGNLHAGPPDHRFEVEGGVIESWDPNHNQLQCSGVSVERRTILPNGLLLPQYSNAPQLIYIVQGNGVTGTLSPGCPETFQESQESRGSSAGRRFQDQHQKIHRFRQGDVIAMPAGVAHWCYNDGNEPVVAVNLFDLSNSENQLDFYPRNFYLAGNPEDEFNPQQRGTQPQHPRGQQGREGQRPYHRPRGQRGSCNNVFCGMDTSFLAEAFNIDQEMARRLQSQDDRRGNIVMVREGLKIATPPSIREEERQQQGGGRGGRYNTENENGIEETFCSMRIRENLDDPSRADIFSPEAGRLSTLNSHNLPILRALRLSAERGVLYNQALMVPHWNMNAHSIIYAIRGRARLQVVDHFGQTVFNGEMREGELFTVPQNFALAKRAEEEGFEWVAFKTNDNAMFSPLAGRTSAIRAMPVEVLANAFRISPEEARRIKFGTQETTLTSPRSRSGRRFDA
ncbi:11s globulin seed storage protein 1 [Turnera subulata]|uniref:11s globulin seed storage protein 1 n=1 Tax=Turnera subulata TaxID=218843 RepID=A0A9Q0J3D3_9ROSI|nr:11s globulin seed storage protein 1 [Turnera subulata]